MFLSNCTLTKMRARDFSVLITQEAGNLGKSDEYQLDFAVKNEKVLFTHNRTDFEALAQTYFTENKIHHGIIVAVRRLPNQITQRLLTILNSVTADEMVNQIRYI